MANIGLDIAGRRYELAVRDGQESHFRDLAAIVDAKVRKVAGAMGTINESRQLLMAALMLADDLGGAAPAPAAPEPVAAADTEEVARAIDALAGRLEKLAQTLEMNGSRS